MDHPTPISVAIADIASDVALPTLEDAQNIDLNELKESPEFDDRHSVMTRCDHFITVYGYPTWSSKRAATGPIGPVSEIFYFYLYDNCLPESTRICWLNDAGTFGYYTFRSYRQDSKKVTQTYYDNRYYATNLASPDRNVARTN